MKNQPNNQLSYFDQVFFLSLRALGHGPVGQWLWVYEHGADMEGLRRFHANLRRGLLGRRVERSRLPFGRHSWVTWRGAEDFEISATPRPRAELRAWLDEQADVWLDPEFGPPWRMAVLPLTDGATAITLVVSHAVSDGSYALMAIADAVKGVPRDLGYPQADSVTRRQKLRDDCGVTARSIPDVFKAIAAIPLAAKDLPRWRQVQKKSPGGARRDRKVSGREATVVLRSAVARVGVEQWDQRAKALGGTSNSLVLAVAAKLGESLGMATADGLVNFAIPVSIRADDDFNGNALNGVSLAVDPSGVTTDIAPIRAGLKAALAGLADNPNPMGGPLALAPFIPKFVARQAERIGMENLAINCSNLGDLDPAINRPDGTDADSFVVRGRWVRMNFPKNPLALAGKFLFPVASGRMNGIVFVTVDFATTDRSFTRERLLETLERIFADFGLTATFE